MSQLTLVLIAALSISIVFVLFLIWRSREGHEDEKGFHFGAEDNGSSVDRFENEQAKPHQQQPASAGSGLPQRAH